MTTLIEDLTELRKLREQRDDAKEEYKDLDATYKEEQQRIYDRMLAENADCVTTGGIRFSPSERVYTSINDRQEFIAWAEENDPDALERKERKEVLNQLARRHLDDGEPLPPGMAFYTAEVISQTAV